MLITQTMSLTAIQRRNVDSAIKLIITGTLAGPVFVMFSDGFYTWFPFINATIIGFFIAFFVELFEFLIFSNLSRKVSFITALLTRTFFYLCIILMVVLVELVIARMIRDSSSFSAAWHTEDFQNYLSGHQFTATILYVMVIILTVNFSRQISRKIGQGILLNFIIGKYARPVYEERIVMFMHIRESQEIIEKIGRLKFHQLLHDFFYDITPPIIGNRGNIYEYVEDEVVVTWSPKHGLAHAQCIRAFFEVKEVLNDRKEDYYVQYGIIPTVQAGFHCGRLVRGEIGHVKSQIVFHGDVMNTASRILHYCDILHTDVLVSAHLVYRCTLPVIFISEPQGHITFKGKEIPMEVFTISGTDIYSTEYAY